jgi:hypothetical protein
MRLVCMRHDAAQNASSATRASARSSKTLRAEQVAAFDSFNEDNDPHREHDFGSFDYDGQRIFWRIDYYDRASFGTARGVSSRCYR